MRFDSKYFDNNLIRFLQLRFYAENNRHLDKVKVSDSVEELDNIVQVGLDLSSSPAEKKILQDTINKHYHGLKKIRNTPLWLSHIDIATALFNNR